MRLAGSGRARAGWPPFFSAADLFVVGSHHEGSGYALMEACACGAVPVVTDIPTFRLLTGGAAGSWTRGRCRRPVARALAEVASRDLTRSVAGIARAFHAALSWEAVGRRALDAFTEESCGQPREECVILSPMASSVLVVDDDPNLVRLMTKFLKLEGFSPVPAANGQEALTYLRAAAKRA